MALTTRSIVTLETIKSYLNQPDDACDTFLEEWIDLASGAVEEYPADAFPRKKVQPIAVSEILDGRGGLYLRPTYWPVIGLVGADDATKLANLQYRESVTDAWVDLLDDVSYYRISPRHPERIELLDGFVFPFGTQNIRAEYLAGFNPIPADIQTVVIEMVAKAFQNSRLGEATLGLSSKGSGMSGQSGSTSFLDLEPKWKAVLDRYKAPK